MAGSFDIYWLGQVVNNTYVPDISVTQPNLRRITDNYRHNGTNLNNGGYRFVNIPNGTYEFYDNDTKKTNILGDNQGGRFYFDGTIDNQSQLPSGIDALKIGNGLVSNSEFECLNGIGDNIQGQLDDRASKTFNNDFGGDNNFLGDVFAEYPDHETTTNPNHLVTVARLENGIANLSSSANYYLEVDVVPSKTDVPGKQYNTILKAVNYLISVRPESSPNYICRVLVRNNEGGKAYITAAAGSFIDYIDIAGKARDIQIVPAATNITAKMTVENCTVNFRTSLGARISMFIKYLNSTLLHYDNFKQRGGELVDCIVKGANGKTFELDKDTDNIYCEVDNTTTRINPTFDMENYDPAPDITVRPTLRLPADVTLSES